MGPNRQVPKDGAVKRVLIIFVVFGLVCFLPVVVLTYLPDHTDIVWRLGVTLVFAVIVVTVHGRIGAFKSRRDDTPQGAASRRYGTVARILLLWLFLFFLNTLFLAN